MKGLRYLIITGRCVSWATQSLKPASLSLIKLAFVYSRSMGGLIATSWAVVAAVDPKFLRLRTSDGHLLVTTAGAAFSTDPQRFFSADLFRSHLVSGLSLQLASHDWLFLSSSAPPEALSLPNGSES